jgi:Tol biopolymer transport system component
MERATPERRTLRHMLSIVAMFGLVVGVLAITGGSASGTYRGKNGRIAFATDSGNSPQVIKTMKRDGTDLHRVVAHATGPDWAPDGSKIVFGRDHASGCSIGGLRSIAKAPPQFLPLGSTHQE